MWFVFMSFQIAHTNRCRTGHTTQVITYLLSPLSHLLFHLKVLMSYHNHHHNRIRWHWQSTWPQVDQVWSRTLWSSHPLCSRCSHLYIPVSKHCHLCLLPHRLYLQQSLWSSRSDLKTKYINDSHDIYSLVLKWFDLYKPSLSLLTYCIYLWNKCW